jgi:hypothetical protein
VILAASLPYVTMYLCNLDSNNKRLARYKAVTDQLQKTIKTAWGRYLRSEMSMINN